MASAAFNNLFKANTITGVAPSSISNNNNTAFRNVGNGVSSSAPKEGMNRQALSRSMSHVHANLQRQAKPLPASTTRRAGAGAARRNVKHGLVVGGQGGAHPTYSVEIRNRGPLDSSNVRPKVSRRVPGPNPNQYTDYLPSQHQPSIFQRSNSANSQQRASTNTSSHTDRVSFATASTGRSVNRGRSSEQQQQQQQQQQHRDVHNGRWRAPTMTVTILNRNEHQNNAMNARPVSAGRERPTASRRTRNPAPEQFLDYVDRRSLSKPLMERSAVRGDRTRYPPGYRAEVMRVGAKLGDRPIVSNMSTGLTHNTRPNLSGGLGANQRRSDGTNKDVYADEGKRPTLSDRFRDVESRQRFRGTLVRNQRQKSTIRGAQQAQQQRQRRRNNDDPNGVRTGGMLDPYPAGDDRWRRSHHIDSTLVSKVKIQAMRQMRRGSTGSRGGIDTGTTTARIVDHESRIYEQAIQDTYAPSFSASANKPQPVAKRQDNVREEGWFSNTTTDGHTTMHQFGWDNSTKMAPHLKRSMERSSVTVANPHRNGERRQRPTTASASFNRDMHRSPSPRRREDDGYFSDDGGRDNYDRRQRNSPRRESCGRRGDRRYDDSDDDYRNDRRYEERRREETEYGHGGGGGGEYYNRESAPRGGGASIWDRDWTTITPHMAQIQQQYAPPLFSSTW